MPNHRLSLLIGAWFFGAALCCRGGETLSFVTTTGRKYKEVELSKVEKVGIVIMTNNGIERLAFEILPEDMRKRFGYDPAVAAAERERLKRERAAAAPPLLQEIMDEVSKGMEEEMERQMKNARKDGAIIARKALFLAEVKRSGKPQTEFERARYEYALKLEERFCNSGKGMSVEEFSRKLKEDLRRKEFEKDGGASASDEQDIPPYLLSEEAFMEWKEANGGGTTEGNSKDSPKVR